MLYAIQLELLVKLVLITAKHSDNLRFCNFLIPALIWQMRTHICGHMLLPAPEGSKGH